MPYRMGGPEASGNGRFPEARRSDMNKRPEQGFTLVELSVVVALIGIISTIAVLGTANLVRSSRLAGASSTLVADLRYARSLATTQRTNYNIGFSSGRYSVFRASTADTVLRRTLPPGVACSSSGTATFYAWGLTDPLTITLTGGGQTKTLQLLVNGNVNHL